MRATSQKGDQDVPPRASNAPPARLTCHCATTPSARFPTTSPASMAIAPPACTTWCCARSKNRCSAPCSTTPAGNQSQAAVILGINRGTLRKKLREFGLSA